MRLLIVIFATVGALVVVSLAWGHAAPERFSPAPGVVLDAAPERVEGWFAQDIRRQGGTSFLKVFDDKGGQVDGGAPVVDDADRRHMYVELKAGLAPGRYLVAWQTLSDEDEEVDGACLLFFVGQAAAEQAHADRVRIDDPGDCPVKAAEEDATVTPMASSTPTEGDDGLSVGAVIGIAIAAAVVGGGAGIALGRRRGSVSER